MRFATIAVLAGPFLASSAAFGADAIGQIYDGQVSSIEREVLALVQAMPADKFDFAPGDFSPGKGTFMGVRTFALQARHDATMIWRISASVLGEQPPLNTGPGDNGPETLKTKDQIVEYFKGAVAYAHKSMSSLTQQNMLDRVPSVRPRDDDAHRGCRVSGAAQLRSLRSDGGVRADEWGCPSRKRSARARAEGALSRAFLLLRQDRPPNSAKNHPHSDPASWGRRFS